MYSRKTNYTLKLYTYTAYCMKIVADNKNLLYIQFATNRDFKECIDGLAEITLAVEKLFFPG